MYDVGMRSTACAALLLTFASFVTAQATNPQDNDNLQTGYCPNTHQLEVAPSQKFFFEGRIGRRHVRLYLNRGGSGVVGLFFDMGDNWEVSQFGGTWKDRKIDASDATEDHPASARLEATVGDNRLTGSWTGANNRPEPVSLVSIPEPKCDGKGDWKRFDESTSRVTFSYPESWNLEQDRDGIRLTCPDPYEIAYNHNMGITMGTGAFKGPADLKKCGDKWVYNSTCDCGRDEGSSCHVAKVTRSGSATILDVSDQEWRVYCRDGGYVGQGDGEDIVVLLPHSWLEIFSSSNSSEVVTRLIKTIKERSPAPAK